MRIQTRRLIPITMTLQLMWTGCGPLPSPARSDTQSINGGSTNSVALSQLTLSSSLQTITPYGTAQFSANGGKAPYYFQVLSGGGTINSSTGYFTAGSSAANIEVGVRDSLETWAYASIVIRTDSVAPAALVLNSSSTSVNTGGTLQFSATGGVPPYTYHVVSGGGTISSTGFYTAPASSPYSRIDLAVSDSRGTWSYASVSLTQTTPSNSSSCAGSYSGTLNGAAATLVLTTTSNATAYSSEGFSGTLSAPSRGINTSVTGTCGQGGMNFTGTFSNAMQSFHGSYNVNSTPLFASGTYSMVGIPGAAEYSWSFTRTGN